MTLFELGNVIWIVLSTDHCLQMWLMNTEPGSEPGMEEIAEFVVMTRVFKQQSLYGIKINNHDLSFTAGRKRAHISHCTLLVL